MTRVFWLRGKRGEIRGCFSIYLSHSRQNTSSRTLGKSRGNGLYVCARAPLSLALSFSLLSTFLVRFPISKARHASLVVAGPQNVVVTRSADHRFLSRPLSLPPSLSLLRACVLPCSAALREERCSAEREEGDERAPMQKRRKRARERERESGKREIAGAEGAAAPVERWHRGHNSPSSWSPSFDCVFICIRARVKGPLYLYKFARSYYIFSLVLCVRTFISCHTSLKSESAKYILSLERTVYIVYILTKVDTKEFLKFFLIIINPSPNRP